MKTLRKTPSARAAVAVAAASLVLVLAPALGHAQTPAPAAAAAVEPTAGEVRKVDAEAGKITLRHAEIRHLDMPPMTMVFAVRDKAVLARVKTGDKVRFQVADVGGRLTVTEIQVVP